MGVEIMYWDISWQPKPTIVLRNTNEKILSSMELEFSEIMGFKVKCSITKLNEVEHWQVSYNGFSTEESRSAKLKFIIDLYDQSINKLDYTTRFNLDKPIIKICDLIISPEGEGLGSQIMNHFLQGVKKTKFEKIILKAQDEYAGKFWGKFGFVYKENTSLTMPSMYLDLNSSHQQEIKVNINYR